MVRFNYTKQQVYSIKNQIYLTKEEETIFDLLLYEETIKCIAYKMSMGTATISRKKNKIIKKIKNANL